MRRILLGWGVAICSLAAGTLSQQPAIAAGIFTDPCGAVDNFAGGASAISQCNVGGGAVQNTIGQGLGLAGFNNFANHLSPIHYYGTSDAFAPGAKSWSVTTNPTWDTATTNTYLRLDGAITLQGPGSSATITLRGELGGEALVIGPLSFGPLPLDWTGGSVEYPLNIEKYGIQATTNTAVETLTINIVGRARYDVDGSPQFAGGTGVPEPSLLALTALVLGAVALIRTAR
jgi:hypothetical protein